jgi:hydrogenase-4 component E
MGSLYEAIAAIVIICDLALVGTRRIGGSARLLALQGLLVGGLPLLLHAHDLGFDHVSTALVAMAIRGVVFPALILRIGRRDGPRTRDSVLHPTLATVLAVVIVGYAVWLAPAFPAHGPSGSVDLTRAAVATMLIGLLLIVVRRRALSQLLGYVVLENGVFALGVSLGLADDIVVEMGILLDIFAAGFLFGVAILHIQDAFDAADVDELSELRD